MFTVSDKNQFVKIWEYWFIEGKETEVVEMLADDITGNGQNELVVLVNSFNGGSKVYVFSMIKNEPTGLPEIYERLHTRVVVARKRAAAGILSDVGRRAALDVFKIADFLHDFPPEGWRVLHQLDRSRRCESSELCDCTLRLTITVHVAATWESPPNPVALLASLFA